MGGRKKDQEAVIKETQWQGMNIRERKKEVNPYAQKIKKLLKTV